MSGSETLTHGGTMENSMDEEWLWYLSGLVDSNAHLKVQLQEKDSLKVNHVIKPTIVISRPKEVETIFGLIDEYCEEIGADYRLVEAGNSLQMEMVHLQSIENFLEPLAGGMIQQKGRVDYFLDEVLPAFEDTPPQSKEEFIELVEMRDELYTYPIQRKPSKYNVDYFRELWDMD